MNTKSKSDVLSVQLQEENCFRLLKVCTSTVRRVLWISEIIFENDIILCVFRKLINASPKLKKKYKIGTSGYDRFEWDFSNANQNVLIEAVISATWNIY